MDIKVGDIVERIKDGSIHNHVTKGKDYKVLKIDDRSIWVMDDIGRSDHFQREFFKLSKNQRVMDIINNL